MAIQGIYYDRYPTKVTAKRAAKGLRSGRIRVPRPVLAPKGCLAHVEPAGDGHGSWDVFFMPKR